MPSTPSWAQENLNLNPAQVKSLANIIKDYKLCQKQVDIFESELETCTLQLEDQPKIQFYQEPSFVVAGFVVSFSLGALFVSAKCLGLCK